jgi:glycosyltransferase involved in cell wall biosynthesis
MARLLEFAVLAREGSEQMRIEVTDDGPDKVTKTRSDYERCVVAHKRILFVSSTNNIPWSAAEELWSRAALDLVAEGFPISASVVGWTPPHPRALDLAERGIDVWFRPTPYPLRKRAWRALVSPEKTPTTLEVERAIAARSPELVVISDGSPFPPLDLLETCATTNLPFIILVHCNQYFWWPADELAERYRSALAAALKCYFVSDANRRIAEKQIGCELPNIEVVRNPCNVDFDASPPWPALGRDGELRFACVGRLEPSGKGQDVLFEVLAGPAWATRNWRLHLYGDGENRNGLERLAQRLGLTDRVVFEGHVSDIEKVWALNHVLVMPSRIEGLPLAVIEAMLCGRPVVATDVAGAEVVEDGVTGFLTEAPTVGCVGNALERFWARRDEAEAIGAAAAKRIRRLVPSDPVRVFTDKIKELVGND